MKLGLAALCPAMLAVALAGCEIRDDTATPDAEASPEPEPTANLAVDEPEETPTASIIRPDVSADVVPPVVEVPEPLAVTIGFPEGGTTLDDNAIVVLEEVLASPQLSEGWPVVLRGHTDSVGNDSGNLIASRRRAENVGGWLVDQGVAQERIEIIAMGEQRPIAPNAHMDGTADEAGRARNRRVEIWIAPEDVQPSPAPFAPEERNDEPEGDEDA